MTRNNKADWASIEHDYQTGDLSIRDLAKWHSVSEAAIRRRARDGAWTRPEGSPKPPQKRREIAVTYSVPLSTATQLATDPEAIAERGAGLVLRLMDELDATSSHIDTLETFIVEAAGADESGRRVDAMMKAISLPSRAATLKALALAAKTLLEAKVAAPQGKKEQRREAAGKVAGEPGGKFSTPSAPKLVVDNR